MGGLAPGRQADIVLLPNLEDFRPSLVIARGRVVVSNGRVTVPVPAPAFPAGCLPAPRTRGPLSTEDLKISVPSGRDRVRLRVIHFAAEIVTQAHDREVAVRNGAVEADPAADLVKVAVLDRYGAGRIAHGLVSGFGLARGAAAGSVSFDTGNLVAVGANDTDMLAAMERMLTLGGGMVVVSNGTVRAEVPFPVGGITSERSMAVLGAEILAFQRALHELGCVRADPFLSMQVLTFTAIPALRIRERGLWDVRENQVVPLFLDEGEA